jgi:nucleoside-diphosphate-sugar epimerase
MKYLVLGSAGQIGLALCHYLRKQGHSVSTFDIADSPSQDLRVSSLELTQAVDDCDFVFFLAWDVGGSTYLAKYQDTFDFIQNNLKIIVATFETLNKSKKPFIFASSQMANMSYSSYGLTKSIAEKVSSVLGGITVKFWNVYGIEHDPEKTHVVTDFINKARDTGIIDMRTDGTELRQMLHADDCSECLYTLSQKYNELPRDKEYHVSNFEWNTMLDVAQIIASHYPGTVIKPSTNKDTVQKDKRNEPDTWILNYWKPKISLVTGIKNIIKEMNNDQSNSN